MEIADLFVINKADRDGADRMLHELRLLVTYASPMSGETPVLATQAHKHVGIAELYTTIEQHRQTLTTTGQLPYVVANAVSRNCWRCCSSVLWLLVARLAQHEVLHQLNEQVQEGQIDPYTAVEQILGRKDIFL
jgi:LAO/AO transport system kinase